MQIPKEDDIFSDQGSKKRASAEKILGTPPPCNKPKIHLYSEAVKSNEDEKSLRRRFQSVWIAPAETSTVEPGKGYRVHRSRAPISSVSHNSPSQQHVKSVNKLLFCTDVLNCEQFLVDTGASVSIINYMPKPNEPYEEFYAKLMDHQ